MLNLSITCHYYLIKLVLYSFFLQMLCAIQHTRLLLPLQSRSIERQSEKNNGKHFGIIFHSNRNTTTVSVMQFNQSINQFLKRTRRRKKKSIINMCGKCEYLAAFVVSCYYAADLISTYLSSDVFFQPPIVSGIMLIIRINIT